MKPILDYESVHDVPDRKRRRRNAFLIGLFVGEAVSVALFIVMINVGPIFPYTVVYAPFAVLDEYSQFKTRDLSLFVMGPALFGFYAYLAVHPRRAVAVPVAIFMHLLAFIWVCRVRAVF